MKQFLRLSLTLTVITLTLSAAAIAFGNHNLYPPHPLDTDLALCDGQPCIMGFTVGETRWDDISEALVSIMDYQLAQRHAFFPIGDSASVNFFPSVDGVHIGRGTLYVRDENHTLSIGWILAWYGQPCGLSYYPRSNNVVIRYPHTLINMRVSDQHTFTPFSVASSIHWQDAAFENEMQPDICVDNITDGVINSDWRGFTLRTYDPQS